MPAAAFKPKAAARRAPPPVRVITPPSKMASVEMKDEKMTKARIRMVDFMPNVEIRYR